jgi:hypothetical protein
MAARCSGGVGPRNRRALGCCWKCGTCFGDGRPRWRGAIGRRLDGGKASVSGFCHLADSSVTATSVPGAGDHADLNMQSEPVTVGCRFVCLFQYIKDMRKVLCARVLTDIYKHS